MKFTVKNYKLLKINNYFKNYNFFFLTNTLTSKDSIKVAQESKKLNLNYYKLYNNLTKQILMNSIYYNYQFVINGLVMIVIPNNNIKLQTDELDTLLGVKLNNKMYLLNQFDSTIKFNYNKNYISLIKIFKMTLKSIKVFNTS